MVGFDSAIKKTRQTCKFTNQTDPIELSVVPDLQDLSFSLLDPLPNFDFIDDWIIDNDSLNMSIEENQVSDGFDLKRDEISREVKVEEAISVDDFDKKVVEERVTGELGLGSLIEGFESSKLVDEVQVPIKSESFEILPKLKLNENGVGANEVSLVGKLGSNELFPYVNLEENEDEATTEVSLVTNQAKENNECFTDLKSKENGDGVNEIPITKNAESGEIVSIGEDSTSSDSESELENDSSSTSSSSSEEDEEDEMVETAEVEEGEIKDLDAEEIFAGSDEDEIVIKGPIKSKNEIEYLPPVPAVDVTLEPHHRTLPVGVVLSIMDTKVVIEGREKHNPLNEGSILWITETRSHLGLVDEIFGPVKNPFYIVRYNSEQEVPAGICEGTLVSFVADFANHVLNDKDLYKKGYDASGDNDEEISDEVEFSDDEKEAEYRRAQRMAKKGPNDRKRGNKEFVDRKKVQHKDTSWKNNQPSAQSFVGSTGQRNISNQLHTQPVEESFGCGSSACSFNTGPVYANVPASASQVSHGNYCTPQNLVPANGAWGNGMTGQPQQHMVFPNGFPMNGMLGQQLNHYQHLPQMPSGFPSGMPFQQQFDPSQMLPHSVTFPYGQLNYSPGPSTSWPGLLGQPGFNQAQFGMGSQGHHAHATINVGDPQGLSNGSFNEQGNGMIPPSNVQGNFSAPHQFNQGATSTCGGRPYRRGGGHFSGRRGRQ